MADPVTQAQLDADLATETTQLTAYDAVRAMSMQISEAASRLPPQTSPTPTEGNK